MFKAGLTLDQIETLDYRMADLLLKARTKADEERINNNILTGAKTAAKIVQFQSGSTRLNDLQLVDYKINLFEDTDTKKIKTCRSQFDLLKANGVDPLEFIRQREQEALNGKQ